MLKLLIPVIIIAIIAGVVLVIHRRESKVHELRRLRQENQDYKVLVENIDRRADDEYTVTDSIFAANIKDVIKRHNKNKEIA